MTVPYGQPQVTCDIRTQTNEQRTWRYDIVDQSGLLNVTMTVVMCYNTPCKYTLTKPRKCLRVGLHKIYSVSDAICSLHTC